MADGKFILKSNGNFGLRSGGAFDTCEDCCCPSNASVNVSFSNVIAGIDCWLPSGSTKSRGVSLTAFNGSYSSSSVGVASCRYRTVHNFTGGKWEASGSFLVCDPAGTAAYKYETVTIEIAVFFNLDKSLARVHALMQTNIQTAGPVVEALGNHYIFLWLPAALEKKYIGDTIPNQLVSGASEIGMDGTAVVST